MKIKLYQKIMTAVLNARQEINESNLLAPLSTGEGVGEYLRYDPFYDQIREARREEDANLSQGIWQTDIKRADWILTESLCLEALSTRTKDLQISGWLCEVWVVLDGLVGAQRGFKLINDLASSFWPSMYPAPDGEDIEHRIRIFEWMSETVADRLMLAPLTPVSLHNDTQPLTLADWVSALNLETIAKRSADAKGLLNAAEAKGKITLARFRKTLHQAPSSYLKETLAQAAEASDALEKLRVFLEAQCGSQVPSFTRIRTCLEDIVRISKTSLEQRGSTSEKSTTSTVPEGELQEEQDISSLLTQNAEEDTVNPSLPSAGSSGTEEAVVLSNRKQVYQALGDIGSYLKELDPHSPAPHLIELIVSWENKNLMQILSDVANGTQEAQMILKLLAGATLNNGANNNK